MNNIEFLEGLVKILSNPEIASDNDKKVFTGLSRIINERWITIHPHGDAEDEDGKKDYRRLKLEDGETPKEAIDRAYGKGDKSKEEKKETAEDKNKNNTRTKLRTSLFSSYNKKELYDKLDRKVSKAWSNYMNLMNKNHVLWTDAEDVRIAKNQKIEEAHKQYKELIEERSKVAQEYRDASKDYNVFLKNALEEIGKVDIEKNLKNIDVEKTAKKIEEVCKKFNYKELVKQYDDVYAKVDAEKENWRNRLNNAKDIDEQEKIAKDYDDWYAKSEIRQTQDKLSKKIMDFNREQRKAISEALKLEDGGKIQIEVKPNSVLAKKVKETNELLAGIINKDYLPDFMPVAKGQSGRAKNSGNYLVLEGADTVYTHIHETMHWLERVNPKMLANSKAFLEYRTKDETAEKLRKIMPNSGYTSSEITKKDKFFSPYCGKQYDYATEIMSMGVQRLFEHPQEFMNEDREYFNFVIANLQGKL